MTIPTTWLPATELALVSAASDHAGIVQVDPDAGPNEPSGLRRTVTHEPCEDCSNRSGPSRH